MSEEEKAYLWRYVQKLLAEGRELPSFDELWSEVNEDIRRFHEAPIKDLIGYVRAILRGEFAQNVVDHQIRTARTSRDRIFWQTVARGDSQVTPFILNCAATGLLPWEPEGTVQIWVACLVREEASGESWLYGSQFTFKVYEIDGKWGKARWGITALPTELFNASGLSVEDLGPQSAKSCTSCRARVLPGWNFCMVCGNAHGSRH